MLRRVVRRVTLIALLVVVPMAAVQLIKETFVWEKFAIVVISMFVVGVPLFWWLEKKHQDYLKSTNSSQSQSDTNQQ